MRQAPSRIPHTAIQSSAAAPPDDHALEAAWQLEHEAMLAPTANRTGSGFGASLKPAALSQIAASGDPTTNLAALGKALGLSPNGASGSTATVTETEYDAQNAETRKDPFLKSAQNRGTAEDYLRYTRDAPLSRYGPIPAHPAGARLSGKYDSGVSYGQDGVQVAWNRIIFPDASSIDLDGMLGLDSHGDAGLRDKVDRHHRRLIDMLVLSSMFMAASAISQNRTQSILAYPTPSQAAETVVGQELSMTGAQMARRNMNVQPTIKVAAGYRFTVRVNRDILFDAPYRPERPQSPDIPDPTFTTASR